MDDAEDIEKELRAAMRRHVDTSTNEEYAQSRLSQTKTASRLLYNEYNTETLVEKAGDGDILAVGELINSNIKPNIACGVAASRGGHYDILSILLASGLNNDISTLANGQGDDVRGVGLDGLEVVGDDGEVVAVNGELHGGLSGGVDQSKAVLLAWGESELGDTGVWCADGGGVGAWVIHLSVDQSVVGQRNGTVHDTGKLTGVRFASSRAEVALPPLWPSSSLREKCSMPTSCASHSRK